MNDPIKYMLTAAGLTVSARPRTCRRRKLLFNDMPNDARKTLTWRDRFKNATAVATHNFYSGGNPGSGDEVLESYPHNNFPLPTDFVGGRYAWALQELLKGRRLTSPIGLIVGSNHGGWGFNDGAFDGYWKVRTNPTVQWDRYSAAEAAAIPNDQLRQNPFFNPRLRRGWLAPLYEVPAGAANDFLDNPQTGKRNRLLAEMFPARTLPAGRNSVDVFAEHGDNFDMNTNGFRDEWPRDNDAWRHSDLREVAYPYTHKLFEKFVALGGLD